MTPAVTGRGAREHLAVLVAVGIHALALVVAPSPLTHASTPATANVGELWEVVNEPAAAPELAPKPDVEDRSERASVASSGHIDAHVDAREAASRATERVASVSGALPTEVPLEASNGSWTFSPLSARAEAPDLSLGDARYRISLSDDERARANEAAHPVRRALDPLAPLVDRDVELGLGRGSPVVGAIREATQASDALGSATFGVTFDGAGGVKVALLTSTGSSWDGLQSSIARLVAEKHVRLSPGHGLEVRVDVEAQVKLADGRDVRSLGTHAGASLGKVGTTSVAMAEMPNVHVEHNGKVCSAQARLDPTGPSISGACSLENIGVPPKRVVAAREVGETRL